MADPFTLSAIAIGSTIAGGAVGAFGAHEEGAAKSSMYTYQAGVAQINQQIAKQNADYARAVGDVEAQESGMHTRTQVGVTKAAQSVSNLDVNSGSSTDVRKSQIDIGQENQAIIRANAARKAYGFEVEATREKAQAGLYGMASSQARTAGNINMAKSIISTVGSVAGKWAQGGAEFGSKTAYDPYAYGGSGAP